MHVEQHPHRPPSPFLVCNGQTTPRSSREREHSGESGRGKALEGLRILIVEDELLVAMHLEEIAEELGCEIAAIAPTGRAAVRLGTELKPDVVLMDINLGKGIDGIETAAILRRLSEVSIIFVTAYRDSSTLERVREYLPEAAILNKPVSSKELRKVLEGVIS
jgi:CheY-like chemotaxis protein